MRTEKNEREEDELKNLSREELQKKFWWLNLMVEVGLRLYLMLTLKEVK